MFAFVFVFLQDFYVSYFGGAKDLHL